MSVEVANGKLPERAIQILRDVQFCIRREWWLYSQEDTPRESAACDSPCCFSGWIAWVIGGEAEFDKQMKLGLGCIGQMGISSMLGIPWELANELYASWPDSDRDAWICPRTKEGAEDGARYIDEFIARHS
jgi:hypothetical protein